MTHISKDLNKIKEKILSEKEYDTVSLKELFEMNFPENAWAVQSMIPLEGITIISGSPSSFKTFLCFSMALAIARGEKFLDTFETTKANILIVDEENHLREVKRRMQRLGGSDDLPIEFLSQKGFLVRDKEAQSKLLQICQEKNIKVLFIDSLVRVNDVDENSAKDMSDFFRELKKFCVQGMTVVLIHHEKKESLVRGSAQSRLRGSSDILAAVDSHISIHKDREDKSCITIEQSKLRCEKEFEPMNIQVSDEDDCTKFVYLGLQIPEATKSEQAREAITKLLFDSPEEGLLIGVIVKEVSNESGIGEKTVRKALKALIEGGSIVTRPGSKSEKICTLATIEW